jgi:hypothetical protein
LSFSVIEELAKLKHVDILVHVSVSDLQRNADLYSSEMQEHRLAQTGQSRHEPKVLQSRYRRLLVRLGVPLGITTGKAYGID